MWYSFLYVKIVKIHFHRVTLSPFWSTKYLNFGGESCEIRILPRSIQETYILRKVKNQVLLFLSSWLFFLWSIIIQIKLLNLSLFYYYYSCLEIRNLFPFYLSQSPSPLDIWFVLVLEKSKGKFQELGQRFN